MGNLQQEMEQDLRLQNLAEGTGRNYVSACQKFVRHYMRSPAEMRWAEICSFLDGLVLKGVSPERRKRYVAGLRFLYRVTLERPDVAEKIPWPKVPLKHPDILSGTEVAALLTLVESVKYRMVLAVAYHLLEAGTDIWVIQILLGHQSIRTTAHYTQLSQRHLAQVKSPLDLLGTPAGKTLG